LRRSMVEPLSCALRGIHQASIEPGRTVAILGGGTIGGLLAQLARHAGAARIIVSEPIATRRKLLMKLSADVAVDPTEEDLAASIRKVDPLGADVVFEAAGLATTAKQAFSLAKRGATIVYFGVVAPDETIEMNPFEIYANEWRLVGSFINLHTTDSAIRLLASGRIDVKPFISRQFPITEFEHAIDGFGRAENYKIQIVPN